ncbi:MAG: hypothetical protein KatS3mg111_1814 [Pirellulaceae bacterium]|nr:MAG: hypothetical protein KatS3mg111_1814 [Pirellulaceae bacterium]
MRRNSRAHRTPWSVAIGVELLALLTILLVARPDLLGLLEIDHVRSEVGTVEEQAMGNSGMPDQAAKLPNVAQPPNRVASVNPPWKTFQQGRVDAQTPGSLQRSPTGRESRRGSDGPTQATPQSTTRGAEIPTASAGSAVVPLLPPPLCDRPVSSDVDPSALPLNTAEAVAESTDAHRDSIATRWDWPQVAPSEPSQASSPWPVVAPILPPRPAETPRRFHPPAWNWY